MFVERLIEALLITPHRPRWQSSAGDDLFVDTARFRGLLMAELRRKQALPQHPRQEALIASIRDGELDEHLQHTADRLIEMGVVREQALLDQFLEAAVLLRAGAACGLSPTDALLLDLARREDDLDEGDTRLFSRRYAAQLGLLAPADEPGALRRTELGDAVCRLPCELVLPFLITVEALASYGASDPWRAPDEAFRLLYERGEVLPGALPGTNDPQGLLRPSRLRRFVRMGLCEPLVDPAGSAGPTGPGIDERPQRRGVRLTGPGRRALHESLRTPPSDLALLAGRLFHACRERTLSQLLPRHATLRETGTVVPLPRPPADEPEPVDVEEVCRAALRALMEDPAHAHIGTSLIAPQGTGSGMWRLPLYGGPVRLRALLDQLLLRCAAALAQQPAPRLQIELLDGGDDLVVLLHDNGPGIPVSQRPQVFLTQPPEGAGEPPPRYLLGEVRRAIEETLRGKIEIAAPRLGGASLRLTLPHPRREAA